MAERAGKMGRRGPRVNSCVLPRWAEGFGLHAYRIDKIKKDKSAVQGEGKMGNT